MKRFDTRIIWGILLIAGGVLLLLQSLGVLEIEPLLWPLVFGCGGLIFLIVFLVNRSNWWALIPGCTLLGLAALIAWEEFGPQSAEDVGASFLLGGIGLSFWLIYFTQHENWWAIIPGGVLTTTAIVVALPTLPAFEGVETGGIFLLGLGATFGLLSLVPTPEGRMKWALIPAAVLSALGLLITAAAIEALNYVWPTILILGGLYLLVRVLSVQRGW